MTPRFCTIEAASDQAARTAGARELDVPAQDVSVTALDDGSFRVEVVRAPSVIEVAILDGYLEAVVKRITPALGDYRQPTPEALKKVLKAVDVTAGLLNDEIEKLVAGVVESGRESRNVTVARGRAARAGTDATIKRHYLRPEVGDLDRRQLIVRDGALLIEREPAIPGEDGFTVTGQVLPAPGGTDAAVRSGEGVVEDAEGRRWTASVPGFGYLEVNRAGGPRVVPAVTVSADRLEAHLDLRPPAADEAPITRDEIDGAIAAAGVVHGLSPAQIEAAWNTLQTEGALPRPALIGRGSEPRPGHDPGILFEVDPHQTVGGVDGKLGQIDFRERGLVKNVRAGQRLGIWRPRTDGLPGRGVDGQRIAAPHAPGDRYRARDNIVVQDLDDGCVVFEAAIDGMLVVRERNEVAVLDLLDVAGDVDYSTGNIDAAGCVRVRGSVRSEFRVTARHAVEVHGSVEEATIEAGGKLDVGMGILGGEQGHVSAETRLRARFTQNANIACGGDVVLDDTDTNSVIEARGKILATEGHGILRGGCYTAMRGLKALELGSRLGVPTAASVGVDPVLERRLREIEEGLLALQLDGRRMRLALAAEDQRGAERTLAQRLAVKKHVEAKRALLEERTDLRVERRQRENELFADAPPTIEVRGTVHPGVQISIRRVKLHVDEPIRRARFRYDADSVSIIVDAL